jgi:hypothetical protein
MIASHRGLQSLGRVLVIGMCCCSYCSIVLLPAFLSWWTRNQADASSESEEMVQTVWEEPPTEVIESHFDRIHGVQTKADSSPNSVESIPYGAGEPIPYGMEEYDSHVFSLYQEDQAASDENPDDTSSTKTKRLKRRSVA